VWTERARAWRLAVAGLIVGLGAAAPAAADTLNEALLSAYLNNPELEAGRARLRAVDEGVPEALGEFRPRLTLDGDLDRVDSETDLSADARTTRSASLTLQQSLYSGGGSLAGVARAENEVRAERGRLLALEQDVLLDAIDAYASTWRDRAVLELAQNNEDRLERQLQATRDRFEVGDVARTDVAQAEARLAGAISEVEQARSDLAASAAAYREIIGMTPGQLEAPDPAAELPGTEGAAQALAETNPSVTAADFTLRAARDSVDEAFADLLPSLDLAGSVSVVDEPSSNLDWQRQARVGLDLSIPLYQGGGVSARVRQSRQRVDEQQNTLEASLRQVQRNVTASWRQLEAAQASIEAFESQVRANEIALEGVQEEALVGQRTVLDILDAEQELFDAQVDLVRARRDEVVASYQLKSAIGELTVLDLGLDVEPYNADAYYERQRTRLFGID